MDFGVAGPVTKILKVLVVGDVGAGRTSLIRQYVESFFTGPYKATIGVDFATKSLTLDDETSIRVELWDIAGQERYRNMTRTYYQEAVGTMGVFDLTRATSLDAAVVWKRDIDWKVFTSDGTPIPCLLVGNKADLCRSGVWLTTDEEMEQIVESH